MPVNNSGVAKKKTTELPAPNSVEMTQSVMAGNWQFIYFKNKIKLARQKPPIKENSRIEVDSPRNLAGYAHQGGIE